MAYDIQRFAATIPAGTLQANPVTIGLTMPARIIRAVSIIVPPGPRGEVGFALAAAGIQYLPSNVNGFIVADNQRIDWSLDNVIESGAWQLVGYNTGLYPHTLQVIFQCDLPDAPAGSAPELPATPSDLGSLIGTSVG